MDIKLLGHFADEVHIRGWPTCHGKGKPACTRTCAPCTLRPDHDMLRPMHSMRRVLTFSEESAMRELDAALRAGNLVQGFEQLAAAMGGCWMWPAYG